MSTLPWLGMDDDADKDLELLLAFKRHKEVSRVQQELNLQNMGWMTKVKNVIVGETVVEQLRSGLNMGDALKHSFSTMRQQNAVICVLSLSGLLMQLCEVEVLHAKNGESNAVIESMKVFVMITSLLSIAFLCMWYRLFYEHSRLVNSVLSGDTFYSSGFLWLFGLEVFILFVHAPPGLLFQITGLALDEHTQTWKKVVYTSDELLLAFMFFRFYVLIRAVMQVSGLQNEKAQAVSSLYQEPLSALFVFKTSVFTRPLVFISVITGVALFTYTYWYLIFERVANDRLNDTVSCLWLVVTTMTKTGYGDVYAITVLGRMTTVLVCLTAILLIVCCVTAMIVFIQPTNRQFKVMQVIWKTKARLRLANKSATTIQRVWRRWNGMVFDHRNPNRVVQDFEETAIDLRQFRQVRKEVEAVTDVLDMIRTELIDYRGDVGDVYASFETRLTNIQKSMDATERKLIKYLSVIEEGVNSIEATTKHLDRRSKAMYM